MCTEGRRIKSRSVCLTEPRQNDSKKISRNSSPTDLEYKSREVMAENNIVCETTRQKIYMLSFTI